MEVATVEATALPQAILTSSCSLCPQVSDPHNSCNECERLMCEDCTCLCDRITAGHALAAAFQSLWNEWPTPEQTLLVQDKHGAFYATSGPGDCFQTTPTFEDRVQLVPELNAVYGRFQACAADVEDDLKFDTEHFAVTLKVFHIEGRIFTASLIQPIV